MATDRSRARGSVTRLVVLAALMVSVGAASAIGGSDRSETSLRLQGTIRVTTVAANDPRVLKVELKVDDGRILMLNPVENVRAAAHMDGERVEIEGALVPGIGNGPFLMVKQLRLLRSDPIEGSESPGGLQK